MDGMDDVRDVRTLAGLVAVGCGAPRERAIESRGIRRHGLIRCLIPSGAFGAGRSDVGLSWVPSQLDFGVVARQQSWVP